MSQFHLKFSFGLPVYDSCHCQEPTIGRRSPFSMHQALRKKPADSWHQRSWNLVLGFLGVVVVFESVGKGPGRKLSFGVDQNIQTIHQRAPWLPKQLLGQGCQPRTSFLIWTEVGGWYATKKTRLEHVGALIGFLVEPFSHLGITLKISKKVMPKHHQCHVVCWPMTRRKRGRRRIP